MVKLLVVAMLALSGCGIQGQLNNLKHDREVQAGLNAAEQAQVNTLANANATLGATITILLAQQTIMQQQIARLIAINRNY